MWYNFHLHFYYHYYYYHTEHFEFLGVIQFVVGIQFLPACRMFIGMCPEVTSSMFHFCVPENIYLS